MEQLEVIQSKIYDIRGQKVMLDRDLAEMYGVETRALIDILSDLGCILLGNIFSAKVSKCVQCNK